jgi:hypothetical protein
MLEIMFAEWRAEELNVRLDLRLIVSFIITSISTPATVPIYNEDLGAKYWYNYDS